MNRLTILLFILVSLSLSGCLRTYKLDVQQGNVITREMVQKLEFGMSKRDVQRTLGTPLLQDPFHQSRWDYFYTYRIRGKEVKDRQVITVVFEDDRLTQVEGVAEFEKQADAASLQSFTDPQSKKKKNKGILKRAWERLRRDEPKENAPEE